MDSQQLPFGDSSQPFGEEQPTRQHEEDLFKKWFRKGDRGGFLTLRPWTAAGKMQVDIGETGSQGLVGNTSLWVDTVLLATYTRAVTAGVAPSLYGPREELMVFGGGTVKGVDIARVLAVRHWKAEDPSGFAWKAGIFGAKHQPGGAYEPIYADKQSEHLIRVTRTEMAEIALRLELFLHALTADPGWLRTLNGRRRRGDSE